MSLASISACGGRAGQAKGSGQLGGITGEQWFCQVAEDLESWDCVQSDVLAAAPVPSRMPVARHTDANPPDADDAWAAAPPPPSADTVPTEAVVTETDETMTDQTQTDRAEPVRAETVQAETVSAEPVQAESAAASEPSDVAAPNGTDIALLESVEPEPPGPAGKSELLVSALPPLDTAALADDAWLIQLVAMRSLETLELVARERGLEDVLTARVAANAEVYYVLLVGPYADEAAANEVAARPPEALHDFQLWVRSASSVKTAMREADALAGADSS